MERSAQDLRCKDCGQHFKTPPELEEHRERVHGTIPRDTGGEPIVGSPPTETRR